MTTPLPIAVLISGGGTTLRNLIEYIDAGQLSARIALVISSNPKRSLVFVFCMTPSVGDGWEAA